MDHFIVLGQPHFDHIVSQYVAYYQDCRPHQGVGNILLPRRPNEPQDDEADGVPLDLAKIKCERRLGGLLKHYYRDAA